MSTFTTSLASLRSTQKTTRGVPAYTRYVNRPLGKMLAAAAYVAGATPNAVSALSGVLSAAGIGLIALAVPSPVVGVAVSLLLLLGYALDSADGQLARLSGRGSARGEWLDHTLDCAKTLALHGAVLVSFFRFPADRPDSDLTLLVPIAFQFAAVLSFFASILTEQLKRARATRPAETGASSVRRSLLMLPIDFGVIGLSFLLLGTSAFFPVYAALAAAATAFMAAFLVKGWRELANDATAPEIERIR